MDCEYDAVILGAGHNSLILQAYLSKAGLQTVCLERRDVAGGGLSTVENPRHPGFLHNTHSFYHRAITHMPWYRDLDLERHGAHYLEPDLNVALLLESGDALEWWVNFERTAESFDHFSRKDGDALRKWKERFLPIVEKILIPETQAPPLPRGERTSHLSKTEMGRLLLEVSELSPLDFVQREFEHPVVQAGLLFFNGLREVDLRCKGFGHHIPALLASTGKAQMCVGGAAELARALVSAVNEAGGAIRLETTPRRILTERGQVVGVETTDGECIGARKLVASGLNPHQTLLDLLDEDDLPATWRERAEAFQYNLIAPLFALNVSLTDRWRFDAVRSEIDDAFMVILGLDHVGRYLEMVDAHVEGRHPPTIMWGSCPTVFDQSQAPEGGHTIFMWQKTPYEIGGDASNWDGEKDRVGEEMFDLLCQHAPNVRDAAIDWFAQTPIDVERSFPNMRRGDLLIGAFTHGQIGYDRPFLGAGHYRGHVEGLYLCGSCCHPGGNITGLPGYNSAQVISADLGLDAPWAPEPLASRLARL